MGLVYHQQENYSEAIKIFAGALKIVNKEFGDKYAINIGVATANVNCRHYKVGMILNSVGLAHMMLNDYTAAYKDLNDALAILLEKLGKDHVEV